MSDYIGTREQVDEYVGSRLVEAAYLGSRKYYDAYSEVSGSLPLVYESRVEHILKNYRIYGTSEGAGVETSGTEPAGYKIPLTVTSGETENLVDPEQFIPGRIDSGNIGNPADTTNISWNSATNKLEFTTSRTWRGVITQLFENLRSGDKYTYSLEIDATGSTRFAFYDENGVWLDADYASSITSGATRTLTVTVPEGASKLRIATTFSASGEHYLLAPMLVKLDTPPDHYIPHRYTSTYPLYIGDSKLGEEEYVDFGKQKVYKGTEITSVIPYSQSQDTSISGSSGVYRIKEGTKIVSYESVKLAPSISGNVTFKCKVNITAITTYGLRVCFRNSNNSIIASSFPLLHQTGEFFALVTMANVPAGSTVCFMYNGQGAAPISETFDFTISDMALYIDPADPPVPLPAITAYAGENTLSSTETLGPITVKGRINAPST